MSKNRKRVTTQQRVQRAAASYRAKERRRSLRIIDLLNELKEGLPELEKLNCPPVRYPHGRTTSIVEMGAPRSNDGDEDPRINRFLDTLAIDLEVRVAEMYRLRRKT